ncbi:glutathione-s-transferase [Stachybotrys elegans]|uniref:Glutathione-s-transferase n=1 Tax=Stachybotrys elegans TaxID=80388 RepID=A0A8K0SX33_9HYPO|nr:glutathione-s-transferase [Stachybotrys elegans]
MPPIITHTHSFSSIKPLILYSHTKGPNPWKVALVLEELDIPYDSRYLEFEETKIEPYLSLNPNGKLPALEDPNHNVYLFESGSIIEYLVESYDHKLVLTPVTFQERLLARSWMHFQMSSQGPACGFKVWINRTYAVEDTVVANEYLGREIKRIIGILDSHLKKTGNLYIVGSKISFADLVWVPHFLMLDVFLPGYNPGTEYPSFTSWLYRLKGRASVQSIQAAKSALAKP